MAVVVVALLSLLLWHGCAFEGRECAMARLRIPAPPECAPCVCPPPPAPPP